MMLLSIEGINQIDKLIKEESTKLKTIQKEKAEAFQNDTNSWHDNSSYDIAVEKENQAFDEINRLSKIKSEAEIIEYHYEKNKIDIGDKIIVEVENDKFTVILTGKFIANKREDEITLNSPLGKAIYKKTAGETIRYKVGEHVNMVKIIEIIH